MANLFNKSIVKEELLDELENNLKRDGRLVCINGYINDEGENIVVYTVEYDDVREILRLENVNELPTASGVYKGAAWFEEEIEEVMPLKFIGLERIGRLFLPEEFKDK